MQLVAAVRGDEHDRLLPQAADEVREQVARGAIGPVQVLDRDHGRRELAEAADHREHQLEPARLVVRRRRVQDRACRPEHAGERVRSEAALELAQDRGERRVRKLVAAELDAVADHDARAGGGRPRRELRQQARLADAGLAAHQNGGRHASPRCRERGVERRQLLRAPDEDRTRDTAHHVSIIAPPWAGSQPSWCRTTRRW